MKCRSTLRAPFIFFFVLVCLASCASPIQEASWVSVKSQRFEMLSTLPEREAVNLIYRLEQLRALIHRLSHTQHRESPVPNLIIAFARDVEFAPFRSSRSVHGYFMLNPRRQYMVLGKSRSYLSAQQIIFHEYIHFLLRNQNRTTYPVWVDEGFAELISTVRSEGDHLILGSLPKFRTRWLVQGEWIPMRRIIKAKSYLDFSENQLNMFYAEAWALVHHVMLPVDPDRSIDRYVALLAAGQMPLDAFETAFGESIESAEQAIRKKIRSTGFENFSFPRHLLDMGWRRPTVQIPSASEVATRLGQLQFSRREREHAEELFEAALEQDMDNAAAHAGVADTALAREEFDLAELHYRRARELAPDDALIQLDWAEYLHSRALESPKGPGRQELIVQARGAYQSVVDLAPDLPEVHLMYGRTYLAAGEDPTSSVEPIARAHRLLPQEGNISRSLVEALVAMDRVDEAKGILRETLAIRGHGPSTIDPDEFITAITERRKQEAAEFEQTQAPRSDSP